MQEKGKRKDTWRNPWQSGSLEGMCLSIFYVSQTLIFPSPFPFLHKSLSLFFLGSSFAYFWHIYVYIHRGTFRRETTYTLSRIYKRETYFFATELNLRRILTMNNLCYKSFLLFPCNPKGVGFTWSFRLNSSEDEEVSSLTVFERDWPYGRKNPLPSLSFDLPLGRPPRLSRYPLLPVHWKGDICSLFLNEADAGARGGEWEGGGGGRRGERGGRME